MLCSDFIYVWRVRLGPSVSQTATDFALQVASWREMLSAEERRLADSFHGENHRQDYIHAHAALHCVLGECLGIPVVSVRFIEGSAKGNGMHGKASGRIKPALMPYSKDFQVPVENQADLRFNLSHTRQAALIGVSIGRELGIDIEWHRPMKDLDAMARAVMSDLELKQWQSLRPEDQTRGFYNLWTRKEAYLKAIGLGLFRSLQEVTVPVSSEYLGDVLRGGYPVHDIAGVGKWCVRDIPASSDYSASICCEGESIPEIVVKEWDGDSTA